jgi:hypothetical protein
VPLSSSLPHPILIFIILTLIRSLDYTYLEYYQEQSFTSVFFLACAALKAIDIIIFQLTGHYVDQFFMTERGGEEGIFSASSDDIMGFGV